MAKFHETKMTIRWGDMDAYGHVNNTLFFRYLESARFDFFEQVCMPVLEHAPMIILAEINCQFKAELQYPADIVIQTSVSRFGNSSFGVHAEIYQGNKICAVSEATMVWIDRKTRRPDKIPAVVREAIEQYQSGD